MSRKLAQNSTSLVQSNSVTSQFSALTNDRETLRKAKLVAIAKYEAIHQDLKRLKKEEVSLLSKIRTEQENLGNLNRKKSLLATERSRLARVMESERKALEDCARHGKTLRERSDKATLQYSKEMHEISSQVASLLGQQVRTKMLSFLSCESIEEVLVPKIPPRDSSTRKAFTTGLNLLKNTENEMNQATARHEMLKDRFEKADLSFVMTGVTEHTSEANGFDLFYDPAVDSTTC